MRFAGYFVTSFLIYSRLQSGTWVEQLGILFEQLGTLFEQLDT